MTHEHIASGKKTAGKILQNRFLYSPVEVNDIETNIKLDKPATESQDSEVPQGHNIRSQEYHKGITSGVEDRE